MKLRNLRGGITGDIAYNGKNIEKDKEYVATGQPEGYVDRERGELYINIPGLAEFKIDGLPTLDSIGKGKQGHRGKSGNQGNTGKMQSQASKGVQGERGVRGEQGRDGNDGYRGYRGDTGEQGEKGEKGEKGGKGQIPYFIQSEDPGNIGAGGVWIKRMGIVDREDVNVFAPRIMVENITLYRKEKRSFKVVVVTDEIKLQRVNLTNEDDDIIEASYALQPNDDIIITLENIKVPEEDEVWETELELFVENTVGSSKEVFTVAVLQEEEPNVK